MRWSEMKNQRDADGNLTPLAMALDAIERYCAFYRGTFRGFGNECDFETCGCGEGDGGSCLTCLCESALKAQWHELNCCYDLIGQLKQKIVEIEHRADVGRLTISDHNPGPQCSD